MPWYARGYDRDEPQTEALKLPEPYVDDWHMLLVKSESCEEAQALVGHEKRGEARERASQLLGGDLQLRSGKELLVHVLDSMNSSERRAETPDAC